MLVGGAQGALRFDEGREGTALAEQVHLVYKNCDNCTCNHSQNVKDAHIHCNAVSNSEVHCQRVGDVLPAEGDLTGYPFQRQVHLS